ncbi:phage DNA ejection protein [Providencia rettgeri]|uniref:phage DNA ejection protein n=1 Tax=unclassified Providencia TaxID=2633465 RepID=UPI00234BE958|nr:MULTISPECIES: phage DNA ejection protein [unclassified Providencia]
MAISPIDYTGGNGFAQGVGLAGLYQETKQRQALADQQQQQLEAEKAFQADWNEAWNSGDQRKIMDLTGKYPSQMKTIRDGIGIRDEQHQKAVNDMANDLAVARQVGTPQAIAQAISKHQDTLKGIATPEETMQMALSNPAGFDNLVNAVRLSTMPADKQFDVQDKKEGRVIERDKLAEDARQADMTNARGWAGVNIQQQNANLARERFNFDKEIRIAETKDKVLSKQLAAETDALKKEELQQKIALNKQKLNETQEARNMSLGYAKEAADLAREIANDSNLGSITGTISPRIGNFYDSSQDLVNKANRLQSLLTQDNLKLMSGVLTDRDIVFLGNIASGLNITDGGIKGSESAVRGRLNAIAEKLDSKVSSQGQPQQSQPTQAAQSYSEGMTATNPNTGQKMIFRGGKWQQM